MITNKINILLTLILTSSLVKTYSQTERELTLEQVISLAQEQSLDAFISKNLYLSKYWDFRSYKASRRPWLEFNPDNSSYSNSIETITDKNGTYLQRSDQLNLKSQLSLSQNVALTGGKIGIYSYIGRLQDLTKSDSNVYFSSVPISIAFNQPLFQYNAQRWDKKIEPLKFDIAKKEYIESVENIALTAVNQFFNLLDAQQDYKIAGLNKTTADTLYKKSQGRYERGGLAYNDLQRLELNMLNAKLEYERAQLSLERVKFNLKSYLRLPENENIKLILPLEIPSLKIVPQNALEKALENNPDILNFRQRMLVADQQIAIAKGTNGINSSINMNFGLGKSSEIFKDAYYDLDKDRGITLSLYVPIIDWGSSKGEREVAKFNKEVVTAQVEQDRIKFEQDVVMSAIEFNMLKSQLESAAKANAISEKTYKTIEDRFLLGRESIETLYAARNERDNAIKSYYSKIREYWAYFYYMRSLTLYDFIENKSLSQSFDDFFGF